jgi:hypothetical protein
MVRVTICSAHTTYTHVVATGTDANIPVMHIPYAVMHVNTFEMHHSITRSRQGQVPLFQRCLVLMLDDGAAYVYWFGTDGETVTIAYGMSYLVSPCFRLARRVRRRYLPPRSVLFTVAWEFFVFG